MIYLFRAGAITLFVGLCALAGAIARGRAAWYLGAAICIPAGLLLLRIWWRQAGKEGLPKLLARLRPPQDPYEDG